MVTWHCKLKITIDQDMLEFMMYIFFLYNACIVVLCVCMSLWTILIKYLLKFVLWIYRCLLYVIYRYFNHTSPKFIWCCFHFFLCDETKLQRNRPIIFITDEFESIRKCLNNIGVIRKKFIKYIQHKCCMLSII